MYFQNPKQIRGSVTILSIHSGHPSSTPPQNRQTTVPFKFRIYSKRGETKSSKMFF